MMNPLSYSLLDRVSAYLVRAAFAVDRAAPLPADYRATAGRLTILDTESKLSISGGRLQVAGGRATPVLGDPGLKQVAPTNVGFGRVPGRAFLHKSNRTTSGGTWRTGWSISAVATSPTTGVLHNADQTMNIIVNGSAAVATGQSMALNTEYDLAYVLRATGCFILINGGAFSAWTLLWVTNVETQGAVWGHLANNNSVGTWGDYRIVSQLGAPLNSDYGIATQRLVTPAASTAFTHTADAHIEATVTTLPSAGTIDLRFRQQDASNYWQVTISSTGALTLNEVVAGTPTQRATAAAAVANGNRVYLVLNGSSIKAWSNNVLKWTYASASGFATATGGLLNSLGTGGVVAEAISWPMLPPFPVGV
jgi:hypothetical protein